MAKRTKSPPHLSKYDQMFEEHMATVDRLTLIILNGHLIIEAVLDNLIEVILFHPKHVKESGRLSFNQKLQFARSIALRKDNISTWAVIASINAVRNEIAHSLAGEKRTAKLDQLARLYLANSSREIRRMVKPDEHEKIAFLACGECVGFLGTLEHDTRALREHMDALDAVLNPDLPRVHPES